MHNEESAFLARLAEPLRAQAASVPELARRLDQLVTDARARWPSLLLDPCEFVGFVAERLPAKRALEASLSELHAADLYLAHGCAKGDPVATTRFHEMMTTPIRAAVARTMPQGLVDDVTQQVLQKLLAGSAGASPVIAKYGGSGELAVWVQIVATRHAYDLLRKKRPPETEIDALLDHAVDADDPELAVMKRRYRGEFKKAFQQAFNKLEARERNLLRHELLDGLTIDEIAGLHAVHRATVARWRAAARRLLFSETRRIFAEQMGVPPRELDTIVRLIQSQLDVSLPRLLDEA